MNELRGGGATILVMSREDCSPAVFWPWPAFCRFAVSLSVPGWLGREQGEDKGCIGHADRRADCTDFCWPLLSRTFSVNRISHSAPSSLFGLPGFGVSTDEFGKKNKFSPQISGKEQREWVTGSVSLEPAFARFRRRCPTATAGRCCALRTRRDRLGLGHRVAADLGKRAAALKEKKQKLKNPNYIISPLRLAIR